ncbi:MAG: DJ-1/PfpI family protein [Burkholderiales bacterium]
MIVIPVYQGVDVLDVTGPFEMFRWANLEVQLVAEVPGLITCNGGIVLEAATSFANAAQAEVLWTPGGHPKDLVRLMGAEGQAYRDFLVRQSREARYVASVCEGALLLAAAGLLDGFTVTTHWAFVKALLTRFPNVKVADGHPRFWLDGNRLTGGGISSGLDEALELIRMLQGEGVARRVQQVTQYYPEPPVSSAIPNSLDDPLAPFEAGAVQIP